MESKQNRFRKPKIQNVVKGKESWQEEFFGFIFGSDNISRGYPYGHLQDIYICAAKGFNTQISTKKK